MTIWIKRFDSLPKQVAILICVILVTVVGLVDYATGYETFFFIYYLLAIILGTWRVGAAFGVLISALSVTTWMSANFEAGAHYSNYFIPVWNAAIMFAIYLLIVFLLALLKRIYGELEERVRLRTEALTREIQERMRLQKELLETTDREQRRIGRDLHDGLCQHLTGAALAGHLLAEKIAAQQPTEAAAAARLVTLVEDAIEMTRGLSHQLDPVELKDGKLADHFEALAADTSQRFNITCQFASSLAKPVTDPAVATHLYRIAQEAITSAIKHGRAAQINISLDSGDDEVVLTVTHDGSVPPEKAQGEAAAGLRAMAYRADLIGAAFHLERQDASHTRLTCAIPCAGINDAAKS